MTVLRGNVIPTAFGRVWTDDAVLRERLEFSPLLTFTTIKTDGLTSWRIHYEFNGAQHTLARGPGESVQFGAELFRKLTGREVVL